MRIPVEALLRSTPIGNSPIGQPIGKSRQDREITGFVLGTGSLRFSLISGCHADEPVGPEMLERLVRFLGGRPPEDPVLSAATWYIVPHVNPDGAARNSSWSERIVEATDSRGDADSAFDPIDYSRLVVRELPGDDIEFGFPRSADDLDVRPENRAIAAFLAAGGPFHLHGSFHGMGFAPGPWFLLEPAWIDRTIRLRARVRARVEEMGLPLFDVDRKGEKGFRRIDRGFSTRPDSEAMVRHFRDLGDAETAAKFRPSSMEFVRSLGGDPLTIVSEMPLFLLPEPTEGHHSPPRFDTGTRGMRQIHSWLHSQIERLGRSEARKSVARSGIRALPIRDQMRLQLELLNEAIAAVSKRFHSQSA